MSEAGVGLNQNDRIIQHKDRYREVLLVAGSLGNLEEVDIEDISVFNVNDFVSGERELNLGSKLSKFCN